MGVLGLRQFDASLDEFINFYETEDQKLSNAVDHKLRKCVHGDGYYSTPHKRKPRVTGPMPAELLVRTPLLMEFLFMSFLPCRAIAAALAATFRPRL